MSKFTTFLLIAILAIGLLGMTTFISLAQGAGVTEEVELDEAVEAEDLEVSEPILLPDSPFYFLKNWVRRIQTFFAFRPIAKAELRLRFASEKLLEVRKLAQKIKDPEIIKKAAENYEGEIEGIKKVADKIKGKATENSEVGKFLDKFTKHQILHQKILEKLEGQVPEKAFQKIKEARERHLQRFGEVMQKLEDKTKIGERLKKNLEILNTNNFRHLKNLEILKKLEEKVPEQAKDSIRTARENILGKLKEKLGQMAPAAREKLEEAIENFEKEIPCAKEGEKVNRNPFLGPTIQTCCPGLTEKRVSKSYSICVKEE